MARATWFFAPVDESQRPEMYNFTNRMALATGQLPNEEYHYLDRPTPED